MLRTRRACAVALLICVGGAGAVLPNYKVSTRLFTHSNDNGQDQAAMHVGDPGTRGFKDPAQTLNPKVKSDSQRAADAASTLVQSITTVGVEGWTTALADNRPASVTLGADIGKGVVGSDKSGESWYFLAPADKFSGDLSRAYNGRLQLSLVHAETPASGSVRREPDVILEATCGHSLMLYNFAAKVRQFCCARPPRAVPLVLAPLLRLLPAPRKRAFGAEQWERVETYGEWAVRQAGQCGVCGCVWACASRFTRVSKD